MKTNTYRGMLLILSLIAAQTAAAVTGAVFTTTNPVFDGTGHCKNGNEAINCNQYDGKQYVWLSGGPTAAGVGDGTYFFAVVSPGGQNDPNDGGALNLSDTTADARSGTGTGDLYTNRIFDISGGVVTYGGTHDFDAANNKIRLIPYDDTLNPGGVYIMAVCRLGAVGGTLTYPVDPSLCKYDAFMVREPVVCPEENPDCNPPLPPLGSLSGLKYYDANTNGQKDSDEPGIHDWQIKITSTELSLDDLLTTDTNGEFKDENLLTGSYLIREVPADAPWKQTGNLVNQTQHTPNNAFVSLSNFVYQLEVNGGDTTHLNFGNICLGKGGDLTLGFWSNKNGQALIESGDLAMLVALNLRNAGGTNFDPGTNAAVKSWLLNANATNMANMLSAQLAAMELNVFNGKVLGTAFIYAPGTTSANANGFATVNAVMAETNTELGLHGLTTAGSPYRTYQEDLKNALDRANNNQTFVQPTPATCPTPVFPLPPA